MESVRASTASREANFSSMLEQHKKKAVDDDTVSVKVNQLEQESGSAQYAITQLVSLSTYFII